MPDVWDPPVGCVSITSPSSPRYLLDYVVRPLSVGLCVEIYALSIYTQERRPSRVGEITHVLVDAELDQQTESPTFDTAVPCQIWDCITCTSTSRPPSPCSFEKISEIARGLRIVFHCPCTACFVIWGYATARAHPVRHLTMTPSYISPIWCFGRFNQSSQRRVAKTAAKGESQPTHKQNNPSLLCCTIRW